MSRSHRVPSAQMPELYSRVGYEIALEALAFRRLAELDVDGARAAFARLGDQLDVRPARARGRVPNARDGIYRQAGAQLMLAVGPAAPGYVASFDLALQTA